MFWLCKGLWHLSHHGIELLAMGLLADTYNCGLRMRREYRERFLRHQLQSITQVSDPGMHHGTCVMHVPWCMSGSQTCGGGENIPGIPVACATHNATTQIAKFMGPTCWPYELCYQGIYKLSRPDYVHIRYRCRSIPVVISEHHHCDFYITCLLFSWQCK